MNDKYPWELWCNGEVHEVEEGVDYQCKRSSFTIYLRQIANDMGVRVHIQNMLGHNIKFCFGKDFVRDVPVLSPTEAREHGRKAGRSFRWYKGEKVYDD